MRDMDFETLKAETEIALGRVMADIEARRQGHRRGVMAAVGDFLAGKSKPTKHDRTDKKAAQNTLW